MQHLTVCRSSTGRCCFPYPGTVPPDDTVAPGRCRCQWKTRQFLRQPQMSATDSEDPSSYCPVSCNTPEQGTKHYSPIKYTISRHPDCLTIRVQRAETPLLALKEGLLLPWTQDPPACFEGHTAVIPVISFQPSSENGYV